MLTDPKGLIHLDPAELTLLALACDCLSHELEDNPDATAMLHVEALGEAFKAKALADAREFYLTPEQESKAMEWANSIVKGIPQ